MRKIHNLSYIKILAHVFICLSVNKIHQIWRKRVINAYFNDNIKSRNASFLIWLNNLSSTTFQTLK